MLKQLIPTKYHYILSDIKNSLRGGYAKTYYSQFGEDIVLEKIFGKKVGFYVDVGAHHPKRYSNTYLLYKKGWRGINIDASPHTITLFKRARPTDINICIGVGNKRTLEYYEFSDPAVNSFVESEATKWMDKSWITYLGKREIPVKPLEAIFDDVTDLPHIDVMTIDVEGMDLEVLQTNNWEKYRPKVVLVESHTFDSSKPLESEIYVFLLNHGYKLIAHMGPSLVFEQD